MKKDNQAIETSEDRGARIVELGHKVDFFFNDLFDNEENGFLRYLSAINIFYRNKLEQAIEFYAKSCVQKEIKEKDKRIKELEEQLANKN
jgi:hypothetical protein